MVKKRPYSTQQPAYAAPISEAPTQLWIPSPTRQRRRRWWPWLLAGIVVVLLAGILALVGGALLVYESELILPGVEVLGVDLGAQTKADAAAALESQWREQTIVLFADDASWSVTPGELGITMDIGATVGRAHAYGRSSDTLLRWLRSGGQVAVTPKWTIDITTAEATLNGLATQFAAPPQDAGVAFVDGRFTPTEPVPGRQLDIPATVAWLEQTAGTVVTAGRIQLPTTTIPPAIADASAAAAAANQLLTTAVTVRAYDPVQDEAVVWAIPPETWGQWLSLQVEGASPDDFSWTLDRDAAASFFAARAETLGSERYIDDEAAVTAVSDAIQSQTPQVSLRIYHHPTRHVVQGGETLASIGRAFGIPYPWIQQANPGVDDSLYAGQTLTIPSPDELIPLPVVENKRLVVSISQQRVWAYENGQPKWEWPASTGIDSSPTSPGIFQVQTHEASAYAANWNLWMPHFMGIYRPVPTSDFMNGFHGFPTRGGSQLLWTDNLGQKVTYGCILVSSENAVQLFEWAEAGVIVEIQP